MALDQIARNDFYLQNQLGSGAFGVVYKALWLSRNSTVACKCIDINSNVNSTANSTVQTFLAEVAGYAICRGPFILSMYGWSYENLSPNRLRLLIIMEYMPKGSLTKLLQQEYNRLTNRRKISIACDIASGMHRIHRHGMIHRDIRPDNILIDNNYRAKIGDMGISQSYYPQLCFNNSPMGCISYMPPEFYCNTYNQTLDVFTFGLTLNHLFTGTNHYYDSNAKTVILTQISPIFPNLIRYCLNPNPNYRPPAQLIEHILYGYRSYLEWRIQFTNQYHHLSKEQKDFFCLSVYREKNFDINYQ
ncbi:unnamed protein product [Rotaria sordida]|uniref:Protein kinase domain-containing protein n=1 Tax=Rotaria sordida TaxID=392033 RepID=A0A815JZW1_9BILA|nr:unnamed protein product [Rotaria sordida]CAF1384567.1 unnamed protein product [Rotaria sordida]